MAHPAALPAAPTPRPTLCTIAVRLWCHAVPTAHRYTQREREAEKHEEAKAKAEKEVCAAVTVGRELWHSSVSPLPHCGGAVTV